MQDRNGYLVEVGNPPNVWRRAFYGRGAAFNRAIQAGALNAQGRGIASFHITESPSARTTEYKTREWVESHTR
jgi:hypothetical protein